MQDPKVLNRGGGATQLKQGAAPLPSADGGFRRHHRRAVVADRSARILIVSGGIAIIIAVVGILAFVVGESLPLWFGADHDVRSSADASSLLRAKQPLLVGVDEYQEIVYVISDSATVEFISLDEAIWMKSAPIGSLQGDRITSISRSLTGDIIGIGSSSGKVGMLEVNYDVSSVGYQGKAGYRGSLPCRQTQSAHYRRSRSGQRAGPLCSRADPLTVR